MSSKCFSVGQRKIRTYVLAIALLSLCITFLLSSFLPPKPHESGRRSKPVILIWTKYYYDDSAAIQFVKSMKSRWKRTCCSETDVVITNDRLYLKYASAVVFFSLSYNLMIEDLPPYRRADQLWILFAKEPPYHGHNLKPFTNLFNWTMTYRKDSDIWAPYGLRRTLEKPLGTEETIYIRGTPLTEWIAGKSKLIMGVSSACKTLGHREKVVEKLRTDGNVTFDMFGACGKHICHRVDTRCDHRAIWTNFAMEYKFYFAAENSLCVDYITEKMWRALELGMVPVVYGAGNYTEEAPPNSYVDARDFKNPTELAHFLEKLGNNPAEYAKYFEWRRSWKVYVLDGWSGFCTLCDKLRERKNFKTSRKTKQVYRDLEGWWRHAPVKTGEPLRPACWKPLYSL